MAKHLYNFMIGQFKRTFQTIFLDEICCCLHVCVYTVLFIQGAYMVLIIYETKLIRLRKILDY